MQLVRSRTILSPGSRPGASQSLSTVPCALPWVGVAILPVSSIRPARGEAIGQTINQLRALTNGLRVQSAMKAVGGLIGSSGLSLALVSRLRLLQWAVKNILRLLLRQVFMCLRSND